MALLDRLRNRPRWENPDPEIRIEAIREMGAEEREILAQIARSDSEAKVRRAALKRLDTGEAWTAALGDADEAVRVQAAEALLALALRPDAAVAEPAGAALTEARHLVTLARSSPVAAVRSSALARVGDAHALATLAKTAEDHSIRIEALRRVEDAALLLDVATKSEHKDVVVAAVDRLDAPEALEAVAAKARNKAASRRARAKLDANAPAAEAEVAAVDDEPPSLEPAPEVASPRQEPELAAAAAATEVAEATASALPPAAATTEPTAEPTPEPVTAPEVKAEPESAAAAEARVAEVAARKKQEQDRREKLARIEALCGRLEALGASEKPSLKDAQVALREARAAQEDLAGVPGKLIQKMKAARAALFAKSQELREAEEWSRWGNAAVQEELCRRMEALATRDDLEKVARELHDADKRWAEVRYAPRDQAETLRQRYQAARTPVKVRVNAFFAKKSSEEAENLKQKIALCERAEALSASTDWLKAAEELKGLQAKWKEIGAVSRRQSQPIWNRFRGACDRFFTRRDEDLKKRKEQWTANLARKEALCVRAEELASSTDWETAAADVRKLQAEWKTVGPVKKNKSEAIWQRFRTACDGFFERYKHRDVLERTARREQRDAICAELEALIPAEGASDPAPDGLLATVQELQARTRQGAPLPADDEKVLGQRFADARNRLIAAFPDAFRGTDLDPDANRARREKLCVRVEALAAAGAESAQAGALTGEALARRLKEALASNTIGGAAEAEARRRAEADEVQAARAAWARLGPVAGDAAAALESRFEAACTRFFNARPEARKQQRPAQPQRRERRS